MLCTNLLFNCVAILCVDALNLLKVKRITGKNGIQNDSDDDSVMELKYDSDDEQAIVLVTLALHEHHLISCVPCQTSILIGYAYVLKVLHDNDVRCSDQLLMKTRVHCIL